MNYPNAEKIPAIHPAGEILKLNPNCCYQACIGCSSIRRLREFQSRHPVDWQKRLVGSVRLIEAALQQACVAGIVAEVAKPCGSSLSGENYPPACDQEQNCEECGVFGALNFGHIWLCPDCHAGKGACCADADEKSSG